jgi:hypothetical protein
MYVSATAYALGYLEAFNLKLKKFHLHLNLDNSIHVFPTKDAVLTDIAKKRVIISKMLAIKLPSIQQYASDSQMAMDKSVLSPFVVI